jgi:hypothetical protein
MLCSEECSVMIVTFYDISSKIKSGIQLHQNFLYYLIIRLSSRRFHQIGHKVWSKVGGISSCPNFYSHREENPTTFLMRNMEILRNTVTLLSYFMNEEALTEYR